MKSTQVPVTVFTGYLGSGKTTIILNLIKQLPTDYKVVWLKNEYGDLSIDSELAHENNIQVKEMLNGCLCCVLVGKLKDALVEIMRDYTPQRIIIESSGTAFPLPIVLEINRLPELALDGVINVIDALNFNGYEDKSMTARMQTECTDLIIINKAGLVDERKLDEILDDVYELNPNTPKLRTESGDLSAEVLLGIDTELSKLQGEVLHEHHEHDDEVQTFDFYSSKKFDLVEVETYLKTLRTKNFIRIKGIIQSLGGKYFLLNWVYGRLTWQAMQRYNGDSKIALMGKNIEVIKPKVLAALAELAK